MSERIRHLERVVGTPVFERTTRGATLTPAGEQLLPFAERCAATAPTKRSKPCSRRERHPRLVIAVHSTFAPRVAAARARRARRHAPIASPSATRTHTKSRRSCSTASPTSASRYPAAHDAGCAGSRCAPDPVLCVVAPDHPLTSIARRPDSTRSPTRSSQSTRGATGSRRSSAKLRVERRRGLADPPRVATPRLPSRWPATTVTSRSSPLRSVSSEIRTERTPCAEPGRHAAVDRCTSTSCTGPRTAPIPPSRSSGTL